MSRGFRGVLGQFFCAVITLFTIGLTTFFTINLGILSLFTEQSTKLTTLFIWSAALMLIGHLVSTLHYACSVEPKKVWLFPIVCTGLSVGFFIYTGENIASVWFMLSGVCAFMWVYCLVTKENLYSVGSLLLMGATGLLVSTVLGSLLDYSRDLLTGLNVVSAVIPVYLGVYNKDF